MPDVEILWKSTISAEFQQNILQQKIRGNFGISRSAIILNWFLSAVRQYAIQYRQIRQYTILEIHICSANYALITRICKTSSLGSDVQGESSKVQF